MFRDRFRLFNPEWFREPPSQLEFTLRRTYLFEHAGELFLRRPGFKWLISSLIVWLVLNNIFISVIFGFVILLVLELFSLKKYYETKALPKHIENVEHVKNLFEQSKRASVKQLVKIIDDSVRFSSWGLVNMAYVGLASWGWEIVFKILYPFITSTKYPYQNLLIGFKNKATDSDQMLWEVAQEKNKEKQKIELEKYIFEYGSKVDDLEISKPTLREQPKVINKLLELYSETRSPATSLEEQRRKREEDTQIVLKNLRIPKSIFNLLLKTVQENVALREDRRHYHFIVDYYIRRMIIKLAGKLSLSENEIFALSWGNIRNKADKITK